jgi:BirA family transcriptional regulator, biotin operon repressor / biotin---[acetyl-CoA-carboxylase] ligase
MKYRGNYRAAIHAGRRARQATDSGQGCACRAGDARVVCDMAIYADTAAPDRIPLPPEVVGTYARVATSGEALAPLLHAVFAGAASLYRAPLDLTGWRAILVREHAASSQYDDLIQLIRRGVRVPDRVACLARTGSGMRGFRGREWVALPGNIHLTVHFAPGRAIERFESAFTVLAAVAAAQAAESVPGLGGRARIKWVNDVLVDGGKVGGVLAYTQTRESVVSAVVLGIGLNVEATPQVERSDFVPAAASLRDAAPDPALANVGPVLAELLNALQRSYALLLREGAAPLLEEYRARSAVLGEVVTIMKDDTASAEVVASGRVTAIGDGLELYLDGRTDPVTRGRLVLGRTTG